MLKSYTFDNYVEILKNKKIKMTYSRSALLKVITTMDKKHFTINDIIAELKKQYGKINIMSVYNNVEMLIREHLIFATTFDGKSVSYELITQMLVHVRCDHCGKSTHLEDFDESKKYWDKLNELANKYSIDLEHFKIEVHGICDDCKTKEEKI